MPRVTIEEAANKIATLAKDNHKPIALFKNSRDCVVRAWPHEVNRVVGTYIGTYDDQADPDWIEEDLQDAFHNVSCLVLKATSISAHKGSRWQF